MKQHINVIVKPTLECNISCRHCYHRPSERSGGTMSRGTVEKAVRLAREGYESARFIWHGGEPLLAGPGFFRDAIACEKRLYGKSLDRCGNTVQTNGTLLKPRFIEFCRDNRINIGVSYEGGFGNGLRPGADEAAVRRSIEYMAARGHMFSVSCTLHAGNIGDLDRIYDEFNALGAAVILNPVIRLGCGLDNADLALSADEYADAMIRLYDRWLADTGARIPVLPLFQYVFTSIYGPNPTDCPHASCLTRWICVHPNGDLYPCGKACPPEFKMGNIADVGSYAEAFASEGFRRILVGSIARREKCRGCPIYRYCNGGCSIDAMADGGIESNGGFSCAVYRRLFPHIKESVDAISRDRPDLSGYNRFVRDAVVGRLINPSLCDMPTI